MAVDIQGDGAELIGIDGRLLSSDVLSDRILRAQAQRFHALQADQRYRARHPWEVFDETFYEASRKIAHHLLDAVPPKAPLTIVFSGEDHARRAFGHFEARALGADAAETMGELNAYDGVLDSLGQKYFNPNWNIDLPEAEEAYFVRTHKSVIFVGALYTVEQFASRVMNYHPALTDETLSNLVYDKIQHGMDLAAKFAMEGLLGPGTLPAYQRVYGLVHGEGSDPRLFAKITPWKF